MATKFYLTSMDADIAPAWQGAWTGTSTVAKLIEPDQTLFIGVGSDSSGSLTLGAPPNKAPVFRGISRPLLPQTISGTVNMVVAVGYSSGTGLYTRLHIYVLNKTSSTVLGTLLDKYEESAAGGASAWPSTVTGKTLKTAATLASVTVPSDSNDYRLVIELGWVSLYNNPGARISGRCRIGYRNGDYTIKPVPALPASVTATPAYGPLWYKYVATANEVISILACNPSVSADFELYSPDSPPLTPLIYASSTPVMRPVASGAAYLINIRSYNVPPAAVTLSIHAAAGGPVQAGDLFIPSDDHGQTNPYDPTTSGFLPGTWFAPDGTIRYTSSTLVASELGVCLRNGIFALVDHPSRLHIYSAPPTITEIARITLSRIAYSLGTDFISFYVASQTAYGVPPIILERVSDAGVVDPVSWILPGDKTGYNMDGNGCIGISRDGEIVYYGVAAVGEGLRRYDLQANIALSPFAPPAPPSGNAYIPSDTIVLADGTVVVIYYKSNPYGNVIVHYSASGTILKELSFPRGPSPLTGVHHIVHVADDDSSKIWVWQMVSSSDNPDGSGAGTSTLSQVRLSDGAILTSWTNHKFGGGMGPLNPADPCNPERFGAPDSCPLMVMMTGSPPPPIIIPPVPPSCPAWEDPPSSSLLPY
jgi:hypothetical protein